MYASFSVGKLKEELASRRISTAGLVEKSDFVAVLESYDREKLDAPVAQPKTCGMCATPASLICARCHGVVYCTVSCQRKHWPEHKRSCIEACSQRSAASPQPSSDMSRLSTDEKAAVASFAQTSIERARSAAAGLELSPTNELMAGVLTNTLTAEQCVVLLRAGANPNAVAQPAMLMTPGGVKMMDRVKELLGARQRDSNAMAPLVSLMMNHATVLRAAAYHGNAPLIVALVGGGAAIDAAPSPDRYTALHTAVEARRLDAARALLEAGASLAPFVTSGKTALEMAQLQDTPAVRELPSGMRLESDPSLDRPSSRDMVKLLRQYTASRLSKE